MKRHPDFDRRSLIASAILTLAPWNGLAQTPSRHSVMPQRSDVSISPRFGDADHGDPFAIAREFSATRLDWTYGNGAFLSAARSRNLPASAALSPVLSRPGVTSDRLKDAAGKPVTAPWMTWPNAYWGCFNSPDFQELFISKALSNLTSGAASLHVDDAAGNFAAIAWGACWCPNCRALAAAGHLDLQRDMATFQRQSVGAFYDLVRSRLPRGTLLSTNNAGMDWGFPHSLFDFGIAEIDEGQITPQVLFDRLSRAERLGKMQLVTLRSASPALNRLAIGAVYALGGLVVAPWDVYLRSKPGGSERYYGRTADYSDLFGLVRRQAKWFDDFELLAAKGPGVAVRTDMLNLSVPQDLAVLREAPDARLALHRVSWGPPTPATVSIRTPRQTALLATDTGTEAIACTRDGEWLVIQLPPSRPWTMVLI